MCGIFGAVAIASAFERGSCARFKQLTDLIAYRGPDDSGHMTLRLKDLGEERFDVFLGNRRLSIIDLSPAGHQPMTDGEGRWIAYNGEIFNYIELRQELERLGHQFRTDTDTEVILHIYSQYGEDGFSRLNGMWAFAIADIPRRRVVLSRDRFSIKPLYLLRDTDKLYFASEIKQLLPLLPKRELELEVMTTFLAQGLVDHSNQTFFRGIRRVPPKTNLVISLDSGVVEEKIYWSYDSPGAPVRSQDNEEHFRELFRDSIRMRLRSDVKVGVLVSGGLDSSSIAVLADGLADGELETYSVVSEDARYSEEPFIDVLCKEARLRNRKILFQANHILEDLDRTLDHHYEPFGSLSILAQYRMFARIKEETDVTVLLSGQGGDEVLLGYIKFFFYYVQQLFREHHYGKALAQFLASALRRTAVHQFSLGESRRYIPALNTYRSVIRPKHHFVSTNPTGDLRDRQALDVDKYSVPALARYEDRNSMAHSLEVRHPFLDHRLVNFMVNLPVELKLRDGWTKYVLRRSTPELPDAIRWRRDKRGFTTPEEHWLKNDFAPMVRERFRRSRLAEMGILDDRAFLSYYEKFQAGKGISYTDIARTVISEEWARRYFA